MKLRIKGNSIRIRLSQIEVDKFATSGLASDSISFGNTKLTYELRISSKFSADFNDRKIIVSVPTSVGSEWTSTDQVSIEKTLNLSSGDDILLLIEKDFKCLTDRPNEDESDLYENPLSKHDS